MFQIRSYQDSGRTESAAKAKNFLQILQDKAFVLFLHFFYQMCLDYCSSLLHGLPDKLINRLHQCVQQTAPTYLCELLHEKKKSKYGIRSFELEHLHIPDSETKTFGDRAFCFSGPRELNKFSLEISQSKSVEVFKTELKTLLFKEYYKKKGICG